MSGAKHIGWILLDRATMGAIAASPVFHEKPKSVDPELILASVVVDEVVGAPYIAQATSDQMLEHLREFGNAHPHTCHLGHKACSSANGGWCMCIVRVRAEEHPEFSSVVEELRRARRAALASSVRGEP